MSTPGGELLQVISHMSGGSGWYKLQGEKRVWQNFFLETWLAEFFEIEKISFTAFIGTYYNFAKGRKLTRIPDS